MVQGVKQWTCGVGVLWGRWAVSEEGCLWEADMISFASR